MDTFEQFLEEKCNEIESGKFEYRGVFENLSVQELIDFGEEYGKYVEYQTVSNIQDRRTRDTLKLHDELKNFNKK